MKMNFIADREYNGSKCNGCYGLGVMGITDVSWWNGSMGVNESH